MKENNGKIPEEVMARLQDKLVKLKTALITDDPLMPTHLAAIHKETHSYPESMLLLEDEDIKAIVGSLIKHTNTTIVAAKAKTKTAVSKAKVANMSTDDLI